MVFIVECSSEKTEVLKNFMLDNFIKFKEENECLDHMIREEIAYQVTGVVIEKDIPEVQSSKILKVSYSKIDEIASRIEDDYGKYFKELSKLVKKYVDDAVLEVLEE